MRAEAAAAAAAPLCTSQSSSVCVPVCVFCRCFFICGLSISTPVAVDTMEGCDAGSAWGPVFYFALLKEGV